MTEKETRYERFDCPKIGSVVNIVRRMAVHRSPRAGGIDRRVTIGIDCTSASECSISSTSGSTTTYDWDQCAHPEMGRHHT
jgi:hypothetical protein